MIKIAVCDDEPLELQRIMKLIYGYILDHPELDIRVTSYSSADQLLEHFAEESYQIYLLDILMSGKNGIEAGKIIREADEKAALIFLTSSPDYAIDSYSVWAFHYILKPVTKERVLPVLDRAVKKFQTGDDLMVPLHTKQGKVSVNVSNIIYTEYRNHMVTYHMQDDSRIDGRSFRGSFDEEMQTLLSIPDSPFVKVSSAYYVNLNHVSHMLKTGFTLSNGKNINVSRLYPEARRRYADLILKEAHNHDF